MCGCAGCAGFGAPGGVSAFSGGGFSGVDERMFYVGFKREVDPVSGAPVFYARFRLGGRRLVARRGWGCAEEAVRHGLRVARRARGQV